MSAEKHPTGKQIENRLRIENRFWQKVEFENKNNDECWPWTAATQPNGYGKFWIDDGYVVAAHRVALALDKGSITLLDEFKSVRHKCDTPACCNPLHLLDGCHKDNMVDMSKRERGRNQKLNTSDAREIKQRYADENVSQSVLADEFSVSQQQISAIVRGESFAYLDA